MRTPLLVALIAFAPSVVTAQSPISIELGAGIAVPVQDFGNAELGTGFGFGANVRYRFQPHLLGYAGWEWFHFSADLAPDELDVEQTGYTFGLRYEHPIGSERPAGTPSPAWWVRAGGLLAHVELEDEAGESAGDTDHGLGWEAGLGISWPLNNRVAVTPGVRIRMLGREIDMGLGAQDATLTYVTAGVGVVVGF
jgi:opacity protein-like surface antigen